MTPRLWTVIGAFGAIAILAATWFLAVSPRITEAQLADSSREQAEAQNVVLAAELQRLQAQFDDIETLRGDLAELQQALPPDLRSSDFVRQLNTLAAETGVTLSSIVIQGAGVFVPSGGSVVEQQPDATGDATESETPPADVAPIQTVPVAPGVDADNFVLIPIAIEASGSYDAVVAFLEAVQQGTRLVLVDRAGISTAEAVEPVEGEEAQGPVSNLSLGGTVFVLLGDLIPANED